MATYLGRFLILSKLAADWTAANPVLLNGELGVSDAGSGAPMLKVGDGVRPWSALPQISGSGGGGGGGGPDYVVGSTTTLAPGAFATVTIDNSVAPPTISFGIPRGDVGPPNWLAIGTVSTGAPGSSAGATITGAAPSQTLNLLIPQGPPGPPGLDGADGSTGPTGAAGAAGPANTLAIGTVTTGAPGSPADATITGSAPAQILSLTIPAGDIGPQGPPGPAGSTANLANPTATIGLVVVNGVSPDAMRSDAAPPLSQAIAPVWTAAHRFTASVDFTGIFKLSGVEGTAGQLLAAQGAGLPAQWITPPTPLALANPTGTISLVASNGVATTAMRSDAAPPLSQAITPVWTGAHKFSAQIDLAGPFKLNGVEGTAGQVLASQGAGLPGNWVTLPAIPALASPTAQIGLTVVNGSAATAMRSDAAPALSQAIAPAWTGVHNWGSVASIQTTATMTSRGRPNTFEWGHSNAAGYASTLGYQATNGWPFLAFHAEAGTTANTYRTRGIIGRVLASDASGNLIIARAPNANADDQALVTDLTVTALGVAIAGTLDVTGQTTFFSQLQISSTGGPVLRYIDSDAATDDKQWRTRNNNGIYIVSSENDAGTENGQALAFQKIAGVITTMNFGNAAHNPAFNFLGTGATAFGGPIRAADGTVSLPAISYASDLDLGQYRLASNTLGWSTGGVLSASLSAGLFTVTGAAGAGIDINSTAAAIRDLSWRTGGSLRWTVRVNATAEGGSAAGSDFQIIRRDDTGVSLGAWLTVTRASGVASFDGAAYAFSTSSTVAVLIDTSGLLSLGDGKVAGDRLRLRTSAAAAAGSSYHHYFSAGVSQLDMYAYDGAVTTGGTLSIRYGKVWFADGSAALPVVSFAADPDSGFYRAGANLIGVSVGAVRCGDWGANYLSVYHATARAELRLAGFGRTAGTDSLDFLNETTQSLIWQRANLPLGFGTNGLQRMTIAADGGVYLGGAVGASQGLGTLNATGLYVNGVAVGAGASGANPTASVGLAAVNGSATTFMRSDAAPALSQAITPTWTGAHIFSGGAVAVRVTASNPAIRFTANGAPTDTKVWDAVVLSASGTFQLRHLNDAESGSTSFFSVTPSGLSTALSNISIGDGGSSTFTFNSNGAVSLGGVLRAPDGSLALPSIGFTSDPNTGLFHGLTADTMDLVTGGVSRLLLSSTVAVFAPEVSAPSFQTTSARALKRETGAPRRAASILSRLRPILYRLLAGDDREQIGLIAEEVHEVCPQLSDGKTVAYDRLALLLLAAWQDERAPVHEG